MLFLMSVALESVRRFHPRSSYFVLIPESNRTAWAPLLHKWSGGHVQPLLLSARQMRHAFVLHETAVYSAMTYHRHRVAQMLAGRYEYSINLDPDVLCLRAWDLRLLLHVSLIGGRPVGTSARTLEFVRRRLRHDAHTGARAESSSTESFLDRELNASVSRLDSVDELNGGILIFNNREAHRLRWWQTLATFHAALHRVLEGDQDLVSLVLAANPGFGRFLLSGEYNFAYRRDHDRLPDSITKRMKNGVSSAEVVNVHFVQDGKPWAQQQQLAAYPGWLLAVRLNHLRIWLALARSARSPLPTAPFLRAALRAPSAPRPGGALASLVDNAALRRCRCFVRALATRTFAQPLQALTRGLATVPDKVAVGGVLLSRAAARTSVERERRELLAACRAEQGAAEDACPARMRDI